MKLVANYRHEVASHCETGSVRNLLRHAGVAISEPMVFGIGSGPAFYYLFFARSPSGFPLIGIRNPPGEILTTVKKLAGIDFVTRKCRSTDEAIETANRLLDEEIPVAASVDMFYMKYLPGFLHLHAPFHFVILVGRDGGTYAVSDPYSESLGELAVDDLRAAWETHAPLAKDNFLAYLRAAPAEIDWKRAVLRGMKKTCDRLLLPPGVRQMLPFIGIAGMRTYARKLLDWPRRYRGVKLREGILFNAVGFEDQGTGGGAFRLMYGAFLQEASELFGSRELDELAQRMIEHGNAWRNASRRIIKVGKEVPQKDEAYDAWYRDHEAFLRDGLREVSAAFLERADAEEALIRDLRAAVKRLGQGDA